MAKRERWQEDGRLARDLSGRVMWEDNTLAWLRLADDYHDAAQALACKATVYPLPTAFALHHSVELLLKAIVIIGRRIQGAPEEFLLDHSLKRLWSDARSVVTGIWPKASVEHVDRLIEEAAEFDPDGMSSRYPLREPRKDAMAVDRFLAVLDQVFVQLYDWSWAMQDMYFFQQEGISDGSE